LTPLGLWARSGKGLVVVVEEVELQPVICSKPLPDHRSEHPPIPIVLVRVSMRRSSPTPTRLAAAWATGGHGRFWRLTCAERPGTQCSPQAIQPSPGPLGLAWLAGLVGLVLAPSRLGKRERWEQPRRRLLWTVIILFFYFVVVVITLRGVPMTRGR
jgi:hypothetical protein